MAYAPAVVEEFIDGDHICRSVALDAQDDWLEVLARRYSELRTNSPLPNSAVSVEGIEVMSVAAVEARIRAASTPARGQGPLATVRSDFAEVVAEVLWTDRHGTQFAYLTSRDREVVNLPGRGIDGVGIEPPDPQGRLVLVLAEAKVSDQALSPPAVVEHGNDSMRHRHQSLLASAPRTADVLWDISRRVLDAGIKSLLQTAATCLERLPEKITLVSAGLLVRPRSLYSAADFARYRTSPADFSPSVVRFEIACVPDRIDPVIDEFHRLATAP